MVLLVFFALAYGAVQTAFLASPTRTIPWRMVILAFISGLSASAGVALLAERGCASILARLLDLPVATVIASAAYLQDPVIEEIVKPLPLLILLAFRRVRQDFTCADMVVMAAALGSGFGFIEATLTVATNGAEASWNSGYWHLPVGLSSIVIPGPVTTLVSWLPAGFSEGGLFSGSATGLNLHLAWSSVAGLAIALAFRPGKGRWTALGLMVLICIDHASFNGDIQNIRFPLGLSGLFAWVRRFNAYYVVAALGTAMLLDRPRFDVFRHVENLKRWVSSWPALVSGHADACRRNFLIPRSARLPFAVGVALGAPSLFFFATCSVPHFGWVRRAFASGPALIASSGHPALASFGQAHALEHWLQSNILTAVSLSLGVAAVVIVLAVVLAPEILAGLSAFALDGGFTVEEIAVLREAKSILSASEFAELKAANEAGEAAIVRI